MQETKTCHRCGKHYPATREFFWNNKQTKDKLHYYCKDCANYLERAYYNNIEIERNLNVYALYKGEELIADGTIEEIAKELGNAKSTIRFYLSKAYTKRTSENARRLVKLGKEYIGDIEYETQ